MGFAVAKEMIFTGQRVTGERALQLGLANRVAEQNEAGDAAYREALQLAREMLPQVPERAEGEMSHIRVRGDRGQSLNYFYIAKKNDTKWGFFFSSKLYYLTKHQRGLGESVMVENYCTPSSN